MAKFLIEVEEGETPECKDCPFAVDYWNNYWGEYDYKCGVEKLEIDTHCGRYNMQTIKITKQE